MTDRESFGEKKIMTAQKKRSGSTGKKKMAQHTDGPARHRKKQKEQAAKLAVLFAAAVIATGVFLAVRAVTKTFGPEEYTASTAEFRRNGSIRITTVESFAEDYYDADELKKTIRNAVASYNDKNGSGRVKEKSFRVADQTAVLVLDYESAEDYSGFNDATLFIGTVGEAQADGYDFESIMSAVSHADSSRILNQATLDQLAENEVIILTEQVNVVMPRGILYATPNLGVTDETHATAIDTISREKPAIVILK